MTPPPGWEPCRRDTPGCEYWTWERDYLRPECCTTHLRAVIEFTEDVLTRHRLLHFLDFGTLLGAVRSQSLIGWDTDGDFGCLASDLPRLLALEDEIQAAGYCLDRREEPALLRIKVSTRNATHADLWLYHVEDNLVTSPHPQSGASAGFPAHFLDCLTEVTLYGKPYPAPAPVDAFLSGHRYGPDYLTPRRIPGEVCRIAGEHLTPRLEQELEVLREREFRQSRLEASRKGSQSTLYGRTRNLPRWALRAHRLL